MSIYRKYFIVILFVFICIIVDLQSVYASDLQLMIDEARVGQVIKLEEGIYEGPIFIDKPLTIIGNQNVVITSKSDETITILSNGVVLNDLQIIHESINLSSRAILVRGNNNKLANIHILTNAMGISLDEANHNELKEISIVGPYKTMLHTASMDSREGNAIDLFRSNDNKLTNITIEYAQDGVYIESSVRNEVSHSSVRQSRYGFHLMFTSHTKLTHNESTENITGMMIMETNGTQVKHNRLTKMKDHVYSQGIMLYDVKNATFEQNLIEQNLIGILVENSINNVIKNNIILSNYIGIQFSRSSENEFLTNDLIANAINAYGDESNKNRFAGNYWEGHHMIDVTGDGVNDWPFYADPIFPVLVMKKPAYQIFADSPGITFLNYLLDIDRKQLLKDDEVHSKPNVYEKIEKNENRWLLSLLYVSVTIFIISILYLGGRKR